MTRRSSANKPGGGQVWVPDIWVSEICLGTVTTAVVVTLCHRHSPAAAASTAVSEKSAARHFCLAAGATPVIPCRRIFRMDANYLRRFSQRCNVRSRQSRKLIMRMPPDTILCNRGAVRTRFRVTASAPKHELNSLVFIILQVAGRSL